jgi:hypothetical protein
MDPPLHPLPLPRPTKTQKKEKKSEHQQTPAIRTDISRLSAQLRQMIAGL